MSLIAKLFNRHQRDARPKPSEGRGAQRCASCGAQPPRPDRQRGKNATPALAQFRDDPAAFIQHVLPNAGQPYAKQIEMLDLVANHRRISIVGCNGSGKDWAAARIILWWLETRPAAKVVVLAPTQRQIEYILWPEIATAVANADIPLSGKLTKSRYTISADRFGVAFSTNKPDRVQGFHSPQLLVIVDEAHGVEQPYIDAAIRLNPTKFLMIGNALSRPGEFYDSHHAKQVAYARLRISALDTPNLIDGAEPVPGLITPEDIADKALIWGEDHPLFRSSVYAEFPDAEDNSLVGRKAVETAMAESAPSGAGAPTQEEDAREPVYIGVDVARFGADKSVLIARRGQRVIATKSLDREMDTMRVAGEAILMANDLNAEAVFVDENGVGGGVCDRLKEVGAPVYGVQFGRRAPHPTRFANLRSEIFWELRRLMNDHLIALPQGRNPRRATPLLALRRHEFRASEIGEQARNAQERRALSRPRRRFALAFMRPPSLQIWTGYEPFLRARAPAGVPLPPPAPDDDDDGDDPPGDPVSRHSREGGNLAPVTERAAHRHSREGGNLAPVTERAAHRHSRVGGNPASPDAEANADAAYAEEIARNRFFVG